ncbi:MAG: Holliday junction resolvase RuvX [Acidobacteriota bacterium]
MFDAFARRRLYWASPKPMRFMGLDVGERRIGIALSDELGMIASPWESLQRVSLQKDVARLTELASRERVTEILVGMPLSLDGSYGPQAKKVTRFIHALREDCGVEVTPWDERFTTVAAERALLEGDLSRSRRRRVVDKVAAALLLQGYLDYRSRKQAVE